MNVGQAQALLDTLAATASWRLNPTPGNPFSSTTWPSLGADSLYSAQDAQGTQWDVQDTLDTIQEGTHSDIQATMDTELNDATGTQFPIIICGRQRVLSCCR
ncbi:hypothetical protein F441_16384, partial [Phytophthora nicotianae CJ01A1]